MNVAMLGVTALTRNSMDDVVARWTRRRSTSANFVWMGTAGMTLFAASYGDAIFSPIAVRSRTRCSTAFCWPAVLSDYGLRLAALMNTIFCFACCYGMIACVQVATWWYQRLSIPAPLAGRRRTIRATVERHV